jgi:hypothetical protein
MLQLDAIHSIDGIVLMPAVTEAIRTGYHQAVQDRQEDGPLHIKAESAFGRLLADGLPDAGLLPEPLEYQRRADLLGCKRDIAFAGDDQNRLQGETGKRADQRLHAAPWR